MKRFFNNSEAIVTQAVNGVLRVSGNQLIRADAYPHTKFVVRKDWDKSKVAIISGGGAGHEPLHMGFVGKGMLTAAVSGEVFASPSIKAVLACILEVTGDAGCLLIVKNYTGDRLNFGLAAERAKKMGKKVEILIVADDIAIKDAPQPRGIAGTLFVHKTAGYLSEQGESLETIKTKAEEVAKNTLSLGLALSTCTLPGAKPAEPIEAPELGLGIHGEPGVETVSFNNGKEAVAIVIERLATMTNANNDYAVIINNLGAVTSLEMSIITDEVITSSIGDRIKYIVGPDLFCTSLNMYGFSLSFLKLTPENEKYLLAPVEPRTWRPAVIPVKPKLVDISYLELSHQFEPSENDTRRKVITEICNVLLASEEILNALDKKVGDGDTGSTFASGARAIKEELDVNKLPLDHLDSLCSAISQLLEDAMGGSSGVLLAILFTRTGEAIDEVKDWPSAILLGIDKMMDLGGARQGSRTMLDALIPAVEELKEGSLTGAATAARTGADLTASITKTDYGRSGYLNEATLKGVNDPGAEAVALMFERLSKKL